MGSLYLDRSLNLRLAAEADGDRSPGNRYREASLNLNGFSLINAGSVLPPESCP